MELRRILVGAALLLTLGGCAPQPLQTAGPSETPAPSETPTTPVAGPAAKIVIGAEDVTVEDAAGLEIGSSAYAGGGDDIVTLLTATLGEPTVAEGGCSDATSYLWPDFEGLNVSVSSGTPVPPFAGVLVTSKVASIEGIAIESGAGLAVGDDVSSFLATLPADQNFMTENGSFVWEVTATTQNTPFGGVIYTTDGKASGILAPGTIMSGYC